MHLVILGISSFVFDSSACLLIDGKLICAVQEERFSREKNTGVFPEESIRFCLESNGLSINDIDHVAFYWKPFIGLTDRIYQIFKTLPDSLQFWGSHSGKWIDMLNCERILKRKFPGEHKFKFHNVLHHLSHAASGFLVSSYKDANILVMDGSGEIDSTSLCYGKGSNIEIVKSVKFPHSMGYAYVSITHYLGFKPDSDEYKVMALASMGKESKYYEMFCDLIKLTKDGGYHFDLSFFNYHKGGRDPWVSDKFIQKFGPLRSKKETIEKRHQDIAWALQKRLEDVALHSVKYLKKIRPSDNLVITGGCGLNCIMNETLVKMSGYKNVSVNSAPHDAGAAIGAAFWVQNNTLRNPRKFVFNSAFLGPEFSNQEIKECLEKTDLKYIELKWEELTKQVALHIREKRIVGWFQGRTEFGPRALGNRSILADPTVKEMKDIINYRIKHREPFRPFAPAILEEEVGNYFEENRSLPFMTFILKVKSNISQKIPAVVHFDDTARVQTVNKSINPQFHSLINEFEKLSGVPILLNTSFNDNGEPIVNTPSDAIKCFKQTGLDYMAIGNYLVKGI
ncbi:MAG: carbamoyl transferase [Halobacteriovoraceae bacterium]|nr:carbamoyl transferase [Halobacteriovoraceae bacterium]|tara:strand:- start:6046 stop:7746 length:1701 start_codon:yes stop_codon:yes gene_type:complete